MNLLDKCIHHDLKPFVPCKKCNGFGEIPSMTFNRVKKNYACDMYESKKDILKDYMGGEEE